MVCIVSVSDFFLKKKKKMDDDDKVNVHVRKDREEKNKIKVT